MADQSGDRIIQIADEAVTRSRQLAAMASNVASSLAPLSRGSTPKQVREATRAALIGLAAVMTDAITIASKVGALEEAGR